MFGALILVAGVGLVVAHYVWWGSGTEAFVSVAAAAVTLAVGWGLLDWGAGITRRWRGGDGGGGAGER